MPFLTSLCRTSSPLLSLSPMQRFAVVSVRGPTSRLLQRRRASPTHPAGQARLTPGRRRAPSRPAPGAAGPAGWWSTRRRRRRRQRQRRPQLERGRRSPATPDPAHVCPSPPEGEPGLGAWRRPQGGRRLRRRCRENQRRWWRPAERHGAATTGRGLRKRRRHVENAEGLRSCGRGRGRRA